MKVTGYEFATADAVRAVAEAPRGPTCAALTKVARHAGCWVVAGFAERAADALFNSAMVLDPRGQLRFVYRKTLLFDADRHWARPGDSGYRRFDTDAGSFTVGICMDLNDDRFVAHSAACDADVVALPTNWLDEDLDVWPYWVLRMRGVRGALAAANTWGREERIRFRGQSAVVHQGRVLAGAPLTGDGWVSATVPVGRPDPADRRDADAGAADRPRSAAADRTDPSG